MLKARWRVRKVSFTLSASGVADGGNDGERLSDNRNGRPPPPDAEQLLHAAVAATGPLEKVRYSAKQEALARHVQYLSRSGALRWTTYSRGANMPTGEFLDVGARLM